MGVVKYLLDTSVIVEGLRTRRFDIEQFLRQHYKGKLYISHITVGELFSGQSAQDREADAFLRVLISGFEVTKLDIETSILAGRLRCFYKLAMPDAFIAACAVQYGLVLVTHNKKDFDKIKALRIVAPK